MEPTVKAALLCDYALTSADGKLSVIGIFGNINFPSLPNAYPRFFVVIVIALDRGSHTLELGIVGPAGRQILEERPQIEVEVELGGADTNLLVDFNNLPFERAGIYQVQLFHEGRLIYSAPLTVQSADPSGFGPAFA